MTLLNNIFLGSALDTDLSNDGQPARLHRIPTFATKQEEQKW